MKEWKKQVLVGLAGIVGGLLGTVATYVVACWVLASLLLVGFLLFEWLLCPIVGLFAAMRAGTLAGRFLNRFD